MESGTGLDGGCVGSIVWVRRRNGSWWPGKILGVEELPASHLASPRTGTPVKLLGREDASVDWYNLEKSKRVKAFRCGEFDDCIERAESSQGMPPKKREKYARREDAILHALELEKELLRKQGKLDKPSSARCKSSGSAKKDSCGSDISNGKPGNTKSNQSRSQETSIKGETVSSPVHLQKDKAGNQPTSESDHAETIPRMRGLQDLGLKPAYAKQKVTSLGALDVDDTPSPSTRVSRMGRPTHINGGERLRGILRAKRSRCMYLPSESFDALNYKEIPQNQIDMSPSHFLECDSYPFHRLLNEDDASEFLEDVESGSSESTSSESESESDSSETEPDMDEDINSQSGATVSMDPRLGAFQRLDTLGGGSMGQGESDESSLSGEVSHFYPHDPLSMNEAVSKWQLKGKRNVRNLAKRSIDAPEIRGYDGSAHGLYPEERVTSRKRLLGQSYHRNHVFDDDVDVAGLSANDFGAQMFGFDGTGSLYMPRDLSRRRNSFNRSIRDWEGLPWENHAAVKREWENKVCHFDPKFYAYSHFGGKRRSMMIDVDLKVQASYQKEPVPIVSLMSKLDGKAIIGHPIQIEALDDNSTETLLSTNGYFGNGLMNHGHTSLPPAWRTAKRTNFRVPRPHRPFALGSYEAAEYHSLDHERKPPFKKYNVGSSNYNAGLVKTSISHHVPGSPTDRQLQRKLPKKVSLFSSQKTRTLSSIGIDHNCSSKPTHDSSNCQMDGLIKPESSGPTTVACIPVKLVFSRLLEKINRPPSKAASKCFSAPVMQ
ncbi:PWWP-DOMAIN INTERACTOR OF POLYCOMBS1, PRO-TRP-PRO-TRP protein 1 [Hibiscus trionum]|uniref:PWWP-DOMAIN INTERACTOR OF POLYCOMBS1, PRO-TRP-PRO-TRP protein 1 n=1 Tax=Hibiscus trionum TaxID=183268 RepID=A0A9W7HXZ4_HIBTR|nr:PWWP-DOMAIN INTERACTOR OF POLYCOMBS1, PRO-TRP-PRO-TRP protein 1 [Hibiscus trionum]